MYIEWAVGICLRNEKREGGRVRQGGERWRESQRPEHGAGRRPTVVSCLSQRLAPPSKERPTKGTHKKPREWTRNHFSLISKEVLCHQGGRSHLEVVPKFCSQPPAGSPRQAGLPKPPRSCPALPPVLQWGSRGEHHSRPQVRSSPQRREAN